MNYHYHVVDSVTFVGASDIARCEETLIDVACPTGRFVLPNTEEIDFTERLRQMQWAGEGVRFLG